MKCCLCKKKIEIKGTWTHGNNAEPVKKGRCCDNCNETIVIPTRLSKYKISKTKITGLCLLIIVLWFGSAYAVPAPSHSVSVNINAQVTVREIFKLTVEPTEINFGVVDVENVSGEVAVKTKGETNGGRHVSLQIKGMNFTQPLGQVLNVIEIENVKMANTLVSGHAKVIDLTLTENYQEFAKSLGNPHGYIEIIVNSLYTIYVPAVDAGLYTSVFTVTMTE